MKASNAKASISSILIDFNIRNNVDRRTVSIIPVFDTRIH